MAVSVTRLPGEPIVIATICGTLDSDAIRTMYALTAEAAKDICGPIYRIGDFLNADASFKAMARVVVETTRLEPFSTRDPRIKPILVCGRNRLRFFPDLLRQKEFGSIQMPVFDTLDEAIAYARRELEPVKV